MIIERSKECPRCGPDHSNFCYITYDTGNWCFSCNTGTVKSSNYYAFRPWSELVRRDLEMPLHTFKVSEFSIQTLEWLYSYFIYDDIIRDFKILYCEPQCGKPESLLIPILDENKQIMDYQRRFFPKSFFSSPGVKQHLTIDGFDKLEDSICITEDRISSIRVSEVMPTLCLFGTNLNSMCSSYLIRNIRNIYVWLDNDEPGINASKQIKKQLEQASYCFSFKNITITEVLTDKQPKEYTTHEIKTILN